MQAQTLHIDYPEKTMYQMVEQMAVEHPDDPAYEFYNRKYSYRTFVERIRRAARAFTAAGIGKGDTVTICLPNIPQALDCFYALSYIGAIANMVHPLSAQEEITFYLNVTGSKMMLTADLFYEKSEAALSKVDHPVFLLVARIQDELNPFLWTAYTLKKGKDYLRFPNTDHAVLWEKFLKQGDSSPAPTAVRFEKDRTAAILYSGGTSGTPKGICLTDLNFNACALQGVKAIGAVFVPGLTMLSCMPCFHGFGLGINLHAVLIHGACCILMPTFNNNSYADMLIRKKPNFIAGVPTIYEALLHLKQLDGVDLSFLQGMFCGGDSLSVELKRKVDNFLREHGAKIQVQEGYGLTECVTASCLTPHDDYREGSIGLPFPDTCYCIVRPGTEDEVPRGEEGEIILTSPTVMKGYLNNPVETAQTLRRLPDGRVWLFTGDLGRMDDDGFVYFSQRIKRMIITKGYNVYPGQLENAIDSCPEVAYSCVIGVPDEYRGQRIKAYVVLRDRCVGDDSCRGRITEHIKLKVPLYALPKEIEFRSELPKTLVGKVAYRLLEEESKAKKE